MRPTVLLSGATATGKSSVALCLAEAVGGEILTVDSMQVYRGMDLGTAKPTEADRARVPHRLIDLVEPRESFDTGRWLACAREEHARLEALGGTAILCGGTGLYFRVWLKGLEEGTVPDARLRAELESTPPERLLEELAARDPEGWAALDRANPRRIVRAVERLRLTGRSVPTGWGDGGFPDAGPVVVLRRDPDDLHRRIDRRVEGMFAGGLVEETRALLDRGLRENRTAVQAIGYRQVIEHLDGQIGLAETIERVKVRTRQYARRQATWFRHQLPVTWIDVPADEPPETTAQRVRVLAECPPRSTPGEQRRPEFGSPSSGP